VFGEQDNLEHIVLVTDLDVNQQRLQIVEELEVFGRFRFVFHVIVVDGDVVGLSVHTQLVLYFQEYLYDVQHCDHIFLEHDVHLFLYVILQIFLRLNLQFIKLFFHYLSQEVDLQFLADCFKGFYVVALEVAQYDLNRLKVNLVQGFLIVLEASLR
jgi:hypothetical protein